MKVTCPGLFKIYSNHHIKPYINSLYQLPTAINCTCFLPDDRKINLLLEPYENGPL